MKAAMLTGYFSFMFARNRKTKIHDFVVGLASLILLTSCQPADPSVQTVVARAPLQDGTASQPVQPDVPDIVGDLIEQVEEQQIKQIDEVASVAIRPALPLPVDKERNRLAEEALNAALGLLKTKQPLALPPDQAFSLPKKPVTKLRIGFLLPFSGNFEALGRDIAGGAEMALFQIQDSEIDIVFFDTKGGLQAEQSAREAVASEIGRAHV